MDDCQTLHSPPCCVKPISTVQVGHLLRWSTRTHAKVRKQKCKHWHVCIPTFGIPHVIFVSVDPNWSLTRLSNHLLWSFTPYTVILRHLQPSSDPENLSSMGSPSAVPVPWHSTKFTEAAGKDALLRFGWKQTIRNVGKPTFRNKTWLARIKHDDNISNVWKFPVGCSKKGTWLLE